MDIHISDRQTRTIDRATDSTIDSAGSRSEVPAPSAARPAQLTVVFPRTLAAAPVPVGDRPLVVGRAGDVEVCHPTVSRAHLAIAWSAEAGAHLVRDLESRNGSALDGALLTQQPRPLRDGSVLRFGDALAIWECGPAVLSSHAIAHDGILQDGLLQDGILQDAVPGHAATIGALRVAIVRAAADGAPVLILGETGTGKERVAHELHRLSGRTGPLVAINCAALQPSLVESELFGHSRGAVPGAHDTQRGFFRRAHGGSLFLDEVGELPVALQAKLLRAIQEREVQPVGGGDPISVDVRVIAATHRRPADAIAAGTLREDLYARLSLWELHVPPLRARRVDLHDWLVRIHAAWRPATAALPPLSVAAMEHLLLQRWPLNLRAIERLVRELANRPADHAIEPRDLPRWVDRHQPRFAQGLGEIDTAPQPADGLSHDTMLDAVDRAPVARPAPARPRPPIPSRDEFVSAFAQFGGSVRALARHFGRERRQIYRWIQAHGVPR